MTPEQHFYSVVASALHSATPYQQECIMQLFNGTEQVPAEVIIGKIASIIGRNRMIEILETLSEFQRTAV
jgi:hypothetical protein